MITEVKRFLAIELTAERQLPAVALVIQIVTIAEYLISVLADASQTSRHSVMFHVPTEISILLLPLRISEVQNSCRLRFRGRTGIEPE